jgi:hypothetical protein
MDEQYCTACFYLEKECHQDINGEYPVSKFMVLLEELEADGKRQEQEMNKSRPTMRGNPRKR